MCVYGFNYYSDLPLYRVLGPHRQPRAEVARQRAERRRAQRAQVALEHRGGRAPAQRRYTAAAPPSSHAGRAFARSQRAPCDSKLRGRPGARPPQGARPASTLTPLIASSAAGPSVPPAVIAVAAQPPKTRPPNAAARGAGELASTRRVRRAMAAAPAVAAAAHARHTVRWNMWTSSSGVYADARA